MNSLNNREASACNPLKAAADAATTLKDLLDNLNIDAISVLDFTGRLSRITLEAKLASFSRNLSDGLALVELSGQSQPPSGAESRVVSRMSPKGRLTRSASPLHRHDDLQGKLEGVIGRLPIADPDSLDKLASIPGIARQLMLSLRRDATAPHLIEARKQLAQAATATKVLVSRLSRLPHSEVTHDLATDLAGFADDFVVAARRLPSYARGRRPKEAGLYLVQYLANEFSKLTGNPPTRSSHDGREKSIFSNLVRDVFSLLKIDASADAMVRKVTGKRRPPRAAPRTRGTKNRRQ